MKVETRNFPRSAALAGAVLLVASAAVCPSAHSQGKPALRITAPADGTVVHPGQSISVTVAPEPGVKPTLVWLIAFRPLQVSGCASQPCYQFKVSVPGDIPAAGLYRLTAVTSGGPDQIVGSLPVNLDVEPSAGITALKVENPVIVFQRAGDMIPLDIVGNFANGTAMDITRSTRTTYTSSDTNVARVSREGVVTAVGTGCGPGGACVGVGMIYVKYGGKWVGVQVSTSALRHARR
jgi:hypothetical protein